MAVRLEKGANEKIYKNNIVFVFRALSKDEFPTGRDARVEGVAPGVSKASNFVKANLGGRLR